MLKELVKMQIKYVRYYKKTAQNVVRGLLFANDYSSIKRGVECFVDWQEEAMRDVIKESTPEIKAIWSACGVKEEIQEKALRNANRDILRGAAAIINKL